MDIVKTIEKHQNGIIGTLLVHIILFIWLNLNNLSYVIINPVEKTVATLDFTLQIEDEDLKEDVDADISDINPNTIKHTSSNEEKKISDQSQNFNTEKTDQNILDELKAFEAQEMEKLSVDNPVLNSNEEDVKILEDNINISNDPVKVSNASAKYFVPERNASFQKIPTFICNETGTVRLSIKVNQKGEVIDCKINHEHTNTENECLLKNATNYAKKWRFKQDFKQPVRVSGWIEFVYLSQ